MSVTDRVEALKAKHSQLESTLTLETSHPHPDEIQLLDLKKQKLRIKDEIASLTTH